MTVQFWNYAILNRNYLAGEGVTLSNIIVLPVAPNRSVNVY